MPRDSPRDPFLIPSLKVQSYDVPCHNPRNSAGPLRNPRAPQRRRHGRTLQGTRHATGSHRRREAFQRAVSERFEREAHAVAALNHSNVCTLHDVGPNYLVTEYIEGAPLRGLCLSLRR